MMQMPEPTKEHAWLQKLIGEWTTDSSCSMGPDQPPMENQGREVVSELGPFWTIGHGFSDMPDGGKMEAIMTLGFDPAKQRFVGSFIASVMTHFWPYEGQLDSTGRRLVLDSVGPSFAGDGKMAKYQDIIEFVTDDHRKLTAQVMGDDGKWTEFMWANYRRVK